MNIENNMLVTVYRFGADEYLKSAHSNFETLIENNPLVAYSTDLSFLFQSVEAYHYSKSRFVQDMMYQEGVEMTYEQYIKQYKDELNKKHADAPVLNVIEDNELPSDPYSRLAKLGVRFTSM